MFSFVSELFISRGLLMCVGGIMYFTRCLHGLLMFLLSLLLTNDSAFLLGSLSSPSFFRALYRASVYVFWYKLSCLQSELVVCMCCVVWRKRKEKEVSKSNKSKSNFLRWKRQACPAKASPATSAISHHACSVHWCTSANCLARQNEVCSLDYRGATHLLAVDDLWDLHEERLVRSPAGADLLTTGAMALTSGLRSMSSKRCTARFALRRWADMRSISLRSLGTAQHHQDALKCM